jgi:hypothetical protein
MSPAALRSPRARRRTEHTNDAAHAAMVASSMESIQKLAERIALWRKEYGTFGKLSGESLNQMDQAARALSGETRTRDTVANSGPVIHTGDDNALDVLQGAIVAIDQLVYADAESVDDVDDELKDIGVDLSQLTHVLEDLHRATRDED